MELVTSPMLGKSSSKAEGLFMKEPKNYLLAMCVRICYYWEANSLYKLKNTSFVLD